MTTRTLRRFAVLPALILAAAVTTACDGDPTDTDDALVGEFTATDARFTSADDPNNQFDVIGNQGSLDLDFRSDGTFRSELNVDGQAPVIRTGSFQLDGSNLNFTESGTTRTATFTRTNTGFTLDSPNEQFDFGVGPQPARLNATFGPR